MESENVVMGSDCVENQQPKDTCHTKFRDIVRHVLSFNPEIESILLHKEKDMYDGVISFDVSVESMGLDRKMIRQYHEEIFNKRFVNFIAEIIIRENIGMFADKIKEMSSAEYIEALSYQEHETFGMKDNKQKKVFTFGLQMSLLQDILIADFKD